MHEREWRVTVNQVRFPGWGQSPSEGVPLALPSNDGSDNTVHLPVILVKTLDERQALAKWLATFTTAGSTNGFIQKLYENYSQVKIVSTDYAIEQLEAGDYRWGKFETLPYEEIPDAPSADG